MLTLNLTVQIDADDPDSPEAEQMALEIATQETHELANTLRRRLEEQGVTVKEVSATNG